MSVSLVPPRWRILSIIFRTPTSPVRETCGRSTHSGQRPLSPLSAPRRSALSCCGTPWRGVSPARAAASGREGCARSPVRLQLGPAQILAAQFGGEVYRHSLRAHVEAHVVTTKQPDAPFRKGCALPNVPASCQTSTANPACPRPLRRAAARRYEMDDLLAVLAQAEQAHTPQLALVSILTAAAGEKRGPVQHDSVSPVFLRARQYLGR